MTDQRPNIPATADTFVHYLFASPGNESILCSFVNAVQDHAGLPPVRETKVLNPFNPKTFVTDKRSIIDIKAVAKNDRFFVIEFQVAEHIGFINRLLYYWSKAYCNQLREGDAYSKLCPVVTMVLTRFLLTEELDELHNTFWITARNRPEFVLTDNMQIHTLELVREKLGNMETMKGPLREWLDFFYYADKKSEADMKILLQNAAPPVQQAYDKYVQFTQDEDLRQLEDARQTYLHDFNTAIESAEAKGEARGIEKERSLSIIRTLTKRFHSVSIETQEAILAITDLERLNKMVDFAFDCQSLDEFNKTLN